MTKRNTVRRPPYTFMSWIVCVGLVALTIVMGCGGDEDAAGMGGHGGIGTGGRTVKIDGGGPRSDALVDRRSPGDAAAGAGGIRGSAGEGGHSGEAGGAGGQPGGGGRGGVGGMAGRGLCTGPQPCQACSSCDCAWGTTDDCGQGCSAIAPTEISSACQVCNFCGDCNLGFTDGCGRGCSAFAPADRGVQSCQACNFCGDCNSGLTDPCGNGCDALAPDNSTCI